MFRCLWEPEIAAEDVPENENADAEDQPAPACAAAEPEDEPVLGRGRGRGRGGGRRGRGWSHAPEVRNRMRLGQSRFRLRIAEDDNQMLLGSLLPSRERSCGLLVFGDDAGVARPLTAFIDGKAVSVASRHLSTDHLRPQLDRAALSHAQAQAVGLAAMITPPAGTEVECVFSTNIFDDANMWIARPTDKTSVSRPDDATDCKRVKDKLSRRGKNVSVPVLNLCESLFVCAKIPGGSSCECLLRGAEVHSPAQVLPRPNTATIRHRWASWSVLSARGCGSKVTASSQLGDVISCSPWRHIVMVKDNLVVNDCIVALEERSLAVLNSQALEDTCIITLLPISCCAHSAVLALKPLYAGLDDLPSKLVKLAHLLESGRVASSYISALKAEVAHRFEFREVAAMPPGAAAWRLKAKRVLELSRAARDLTEADEEFILACDNGTDWDDREKIVHMCIRGRCPLECAGSRAKALRSVQAGMLLSVGGSMVVPLLYRWKGFSEASAWAWRARRQHDLLYAALRRVFPANVVKKAEADVAAGIDGDGVVKNAVRAAGVLRFLEADTGGRRLEIACAMQKPLQSFLDFTFAAEKSTCRVVENVSLTPSHATKMDPGVAAVIPKAQRRNWQILSGQQGRRVVKEYSDMLLSFGDHAWSGLMLSHAEKYKVAAGVLLTMASAWRRLVFGYDQPKYKIFAVCQYSNMHHWRSAAEALRAEVEHCGDCVDPGFTKVWLSRLLSADLHTAKKAQRCLTQMLPCLPVCAAKCERKHLLGQQTRQVKKRGKGFLAQTVSKITYVKSVKKAAARAKEHVVQDVLGNDKKVIRAFGQSMVAFRVGRCRRKKQCSGKMFRKKKSLRAVSGLDMFASIFSDDHPELHVLPLKQRRLRTVQAWAKESVASKRHYADLAAGESAGRDTRASETFRQCVARQAGEAGHRHQRHTSERRRALARSIADMEKHDVWTAGSQTFCFDSGLKETVVSQLPDADIKEECGHLFAYNDREEQNPAGSMKPFTTCKQQFGGLCCQDELCGRANMGTKNMCILLSKHKLKDALPLLLQVCVAGAEPVAEYHFLAGTHAGKLGLLIAASIVVIEGKRVATLATDAVTGACVVSTTQIVFRRILAASAEAMDTSALDIEHLQLLQFEYARHEDAAGFAAGIAAEAEPFLLLADLRHKDKKHRAEDGVALPFGLSMASDDKCKGEDGEEHAPADDGSASSDMEKEEDVLARRDDEKLSSESEYDGPAALPEALPPAPEPAPAIPIVGVKGYDKAPTGRAVCWLCGVPIPAGSWRLDYRFRASRQLSHQRRIHAHCAGRLPASSREHDITVVRRFLEAPGLEGDASPFLENVLELLRGPSGAASSA